MRFQLVAAAIVMTLTSAAVAEVDNFAFLFAFGTSC